MPGTPRPRKNKDGTTSYQARWRPPGDGRDSQRRTRSFPTRREANRWIADMDADYHRGVHTDPRRGQVTLARIADEWRAAELHHLKPKTIAGYEHILAKHISPAFGDRKLQALTAHQIQVWVNEFAQSHQPSTIRNVYGVLTRLLDFAVRRRYLPVSPADSVRLPRATHAQADRRRRQLILGPAEIRSVADQMPTPAYRAATYLAAYCGLRAGELWALQRQHVDLLHRSVTVARAQTEVTGQSLVYGPPKSAAAHRTIKVPAQVAGILAAYLGTPTANQDPAALVFMTPSGTPVRQTNFYKRVFKPAVRSTLPERLHALRFHDLRHTCASLCLSSTPNLHIVKERLGHEDIRTTVNLYGHLVPSVDAALADALDALFTQADNVIQLPRRDADPRST